MKKFILILLSFTLLTSCLNEDLPKDYTEENELEIQQYLTDNNLVATKDEYGVYYVIQEDGIGEYPSSGDIVSITYDGYLTNNEEITSSNDKLSFLTLDNISILGLRIGLKYFKPGSSGKIILPSSLAYGEGSVIIFDVELDQIYEDIDTANEAEIENYITDNEINDFIKTDSGLYYIIEEEGTGENPTSEDTVTVAYKGYYTNEVTFDESSVSGGSFSLQSVIQGWTEGIPYFKEGGSGKLLIPSSLGYNDGVVRIFDVELISIN